MVHARAESAYIRSKILKTNARLGMPLMFLRPTGIAHVVRQLLKLLTIANNSRGKHARQISTSLELQIGREAQGWRSHGVVRENKQRSKLGVNVLTAIEGWFVNEAAILDMLIAVPALKCPTCYVSAYAPCSISFVSM